MSYKLPFLIISIQFFKILIDTASYLMRYLILPRNVIIISDYIRRVLSC